ncbi:MAG: M12 family metallo-peptidase [Planctomycetota bacterium]|jgi:hypothetical protein
MRLTTSAASVVACLAWAGVSNAQQTFDFPLDVTGDGLAPGQLTLEPRLDELPALTGADEAVLQGVPFPNGQVVDVAVRRVELDELKLGFQVNGVQAPNMLDGLDLSVWTGSVVGEEVSEVMLSFSNVGVRGWVRTPGRTIHLMPQPDGNGDWSRSEVLVADEASLGQLGMALKLECASDLVNDFVEEEVKQKRPVDQGVQGPEQGFLGTVVGTLYECPMAIETDYQLNQVFGGDLAAQTSYITTLLAAASDRYVEQIDTRITYPYIQFYTDSNDPWTSQDSSGSGTSDLLNEFRTAWEGNLPNDTVLGHFVSGAGLGGGVAYLDGICDTSESISFAVSANIDGLVPFPVQQGPVNWDFIVFTHECGHSFGSPHTHDYSPQIDGCAFGDCISNGTIMSYCHLCSGGLSNMTTFFHPTVIEVMKQGASNCLPILVGFNELADAVVPPGAAIPVDVTVFGSPNSGVDLHYRFSSTDSFTTVALTDNGGGNWSGQIPAPQCGDSPEYFFSMDDATEGPVQSETFTNQVGNETVFFEDDFQTNQGWTVGAPDDDATTGVWERDDPLGTTAQPPFGVDDGGTFCYFTGQGSSGGGLGENDVDGGKTTLFSPSLDLTGTDAQIGYWRWYSNNTSASPNADIFEVEVSNGGAWVNVETVGPSGPESNGGWYFHEFTVSDFVSPNASVQVRFIASDEGDGSIVEAAIDGFVVREVSCELCQSDLGFGGPGTATLAICGEALSSGNSAELKIENAPAGAAAFVATSNALNPTPLFGGTVVTLPTLQLFTLTTDGNGEATLPVPGGFGPATLYLQGAVVDLSLPELVQLTNAVQADFLP